MNSYLLYRNCEAICSLKYLHNIILCNVVLFILNLIAILLLDVLR